MSMSMHVMGFRPPDETWAKMKAVWETCRKAGVTPPDEVVEFFNDEEPDEEGMEVPLGDAAVNWEDNMTRGFQVDIRKLPPSVYLLRFYCGW